MKEIQCQDVDLLLRKWANVIEEWYLREIWIAFSVLVPIHIYFCIIYFSFSISQPLCLQFYLSSWRQLINPKILLQGNPSLSGFKILLNYVYFQQKSICYNVGSFYSKKQRIIFHISSWSFLRRKKSLWLKWSSMLSEQTSLIWKFI